MSAAEKFLPVVRFVDVPECTSVNQGKCANFSCRYSVLESWSRFEQWPEEERQELLDVLPDTCCLGLAEQGGMTTEQIAAFLGLTRETVERTEAVALRKLHMRRDLRSVR